MKHYVFDNAAVSLRGHKASIEFFEPIFTDRDRELLIVAFCDEDLRLMNLHCFPGTRDEVQVKISELFRSALRWPFSGIVLAHNHPSADVHPSAADRELTKRLALIAEALDTTLLDHVIFNHGEPFSFRSSGHL